MEAPEDFKWHVRAQESADCADVNEWAFFTNTEVAKYRERYTYCLGDQARHINRPTSVDAIKHTHHFWHT